MSYGRKLACLLRRQAPEVSLCARASGYCSWDWPLAVNKRAIVVRYQGIPVPPRRARRTAVPRAAAPRAAVLRAAAPRAAVLRTAAPRAAAPRAAARPTAAPAPAAPP